MDLDRTRISLNASVLVLCSCGWKPLFHSSLRLVKTKEMKRSKAKEEAKVRSEPFPPSFFPWRLWHGSDPGWRGVKALRLRGKELTGLPQAPLCSSNGLLRRHGGVRNIISSYSPRDFLDFPPFSGVTFQIPQWLHLFYPKNQPYQWNQRRLHSSLVI